MYQKSGSEAPSKARVRHSKKHQTQRSISIAVLKCRAKWRSRYLRGISRIRVRIKVVIWMCVDVARGFDSHRNIFHYHTRQNNALDITAPSSSRLQFNPHNRFPIGNSILIPTTFERNSILTHANVAVFNADMVGRI
nr:hypothetical protein Iba_chr12cCG17800 [Ipomoea batatas]